MIGSVTMGCTTRGLAATNTTRNDCSLRVVFFYAPVRHRDQHDRTDEHKAVPPRLAIPRKQQQRQNAQKRSHRSSPTLPSTLSTVKSKIAQVFAPTAHNHDYRT